MEAVLRLKPEGESLSGDFLRPGVPVTPGAPWPTSAALALPLPSGVSCVCLHVPVFLQGH